MSFSLENESANRTTTTRANKGKTSRHFAHKVPIYHLLCCSAMYCAHWDDPHKVAATPSLYPHSSLLFFSVGSG